MTGPHLMIVVYKYTVSEESTFILFRISLRHTQNKERENIFTAHLKQNQSAYLPKREGVSS